MIYLAAPYSSSDKYTVADRVFKINNATVHLLNKGYFVYSPISSWHYLAIQYDLPKEFEFWKLFDTHIISKCDKIIVLKLNGWDKSKGVLAEIEYARELGIPIEYLEYDEIRKEIKS